MLQEGRALLGGPHAPVGALEYGVAQLLLDLVQYAAQVGLAQEQVGRRLGDGAGALDLHHVLQIAGMHFNPRFYPFSVPL